MIEEEAYPLSPLQQGMLFEHLKEPHAGMDLVQIICESAERFNRLNFESAWQRVIGRHDILRTGFGWKDVDEPRQEVQSEVEMPFEWHERYLWPLRKREVQWEEYLHRDRSRGFDLEKAPLMRVAMFRAGWRRWRMCWTFHHLLLDGRGVRQVLNEVYAIYEALERGEELSLPVASPFRDYIEWHQRADWTAAEKYWREKLKGFHAPTALPILNPLKSADRQQEAWAEELTELSPGVSNALKTLAVSAGVTLNTVLQGAWALLLSRYSGEKDVVFGAIRACRKSNIPDAEMTVGIFVNTLPMRVHVRSEASIADWLREVRDQWMSMRDFENTPLVSVQSWSGVPRGVRLFDTIFNFQEPSWDIALASQGGAWSKRQFSLRNQPGYPLTADIYGGGKSLILKLNYDPRRLDRPSIVRMLGHFEMLLTNMAGDPAAALSKIEMLRPEEKREIVVDWNQTRTDYPRQRCIHELFEAQVKRAPGSIAVVYGKTQLTYQKLDYRANRIANYLKSRGVGRGTMVGICLERSVNMVAALLGILKAGGTYVPLDPEYPKDRLAFMVRDMQAPILVTSEQLRKSLPETSAEVICLDSDWASIRQHSSDPVPGCGTTADDLAYVIYTSGSTGIPKGVCVPHRGVVRLVKETNYACFNASEVFLQFAPIAFDASTFEIWGALLNGARLVVYPPGISALEELGNFIVREKITTLWLTAVLFQQMVERDTSCLRGIRQLLAGGDVLPLEQVRKVLRELPQCCLINGYGPTENTTFTCCHPIRALDNLGTSVSIGRPIANTRVYVLDHDRQPVPIGIPGELYTGGDGLAQCYLNQPDLTEKKFVSDPFNTGIGARLYRTGDLVRWMPDGNIEFLGRLDHQVKIRGFRIELGEIESVLLQHPMVRAAVVILREDTPGDKRLAAYVVPKHNMDIRHPRSFLSDRLPSYMVPSSIMVLQELPLSPNGKVDRQALPKPERCETNGAIVAPSTAMEEKMTELWGDILGLVSVSVHDNFFEQGGHSLKAMQLVSRLRAVHKMDMPIKWLFEYPTVASLSAKIEDTLGTDQKFDIPPILPVAGDRLLPLSLFQDRIWSFCQNDQENRYSSLIPIRLHGKLNFPVFKKSILEVLRRHHILRTSVEMREGRMAQVVHPAEEVPINIIDVMDQCMSHEDLLRLHEEERSKPYDLQCVWLLRLNFVHVSANCHEFHLLVHHMLYDASFREVFFRELQTLFSAFSQDEVSPLPEPTSQYGDFSVWQGLWLQPGAYLYDRQLNYWKKTLAGVPVALRLSFEQPKPETQNLVGCTQIICIEDEPLAAIRTFSQKEGVTLFMTVLAAINAVLRFYTPPGDLVVGTYLANRNLLEMEQVIGLQSNLVLLRTDVSKDATFREILGQVRHVLLEAHEYQDIPHNMLEQAFAAEGIVTPEVRMLVLHSFLDERENQKQLGEMEMELIFPSKTMSMPWGITLQNIETNSGLKCGIHFNTDLYETVATREMFARICRLMQLAVRTPDSTIEALFSASYSPENKG